ncbi:hypothetical protein COCSUDRAFT_60512 [Coccomyxa subellipsoidea C-169]|uniref:Uncharacterized protein n=1 Tax=Coccomyxa subellipsoidea (strain C-169) TaxID=574566 RepID=I0YIB9_COCSC|nr:hypothetical protein COCSUDRAFT_60512 [Coccomyxa subellipsoidea C-169]EIE18138.1 hypothetical protein COCSUDRAFT_60512 [Coccomyxa subellipsoidea C-169]|eukprot:XP_005642682.1 hypothetical protein COCSUDRAFT_60512 [Coccomyxa subellipsoidea C-169]
MCGACDEVSGHEMLRLQIQTVLHALNLLNEGTSAGSEPGVHLVFLPTLSKLRNGDASFLESMSNSYLKAGGTMPLEPSFGDHQRRPPLRRRHYVQTSQRWLTSLQSSKTEDSIAVPQAGQCWQNSQVDAGFEPAPAEVPSLSRLRPWSTV